MGKEKADASLSRAPEIQDRIPDNHPFRVGVAFLSGLVSVAFHLSLPTWAMTRILGTHTMWVA
jgi:hypothetical protein